MRIKGLMKIFKPRDKKLHGNTVYDFAIPADSDNKFVGSDSDGLKRQLICAENENKRLTEEVEELRKMVLKLQEKKTNYERAEKRKIDSMANAMNKYYQKEDDLDSVDTDELDSVDDSDSDDEYSLKLS